MRINLLLFLYNFLIVSGLLGFGWLLPPLILTSPKRRQTFLHRLGLKQAPHPTSPTDRPFKSIASGIRMRMKSSGGRRPIWVHALSVGEVVSATPLVKALHARFSDRALVFTASTQTGFQTAARILDQYADEIAYFPYDLPFCVQKSIKRIDPALVIIVETDIWPNFMHFARARNIPVMLVNARISSKAMRGYLRFGFFTQLMFGAFTTVCVQSRADVSRFYRLGIALERLEVCGNMKFDAQLLETGDLDMDTFKQELHLCGSFPIIVAGSTHPGEETIILDAWSRLKQNQPELFFIIVPRDPHRSDEVRRLCQDAGLSAHTLTQWRGRPDSARRPDVLIVDGIGQLQTLYSIAHIAFIGGSLAPCGGHNPLEAALFAKPILFGPDMRDFESIRRKLLHAQAALQVNDADDLYHALTQLLSDPHRARNMGQNAYQVVLQNRGAATKIVDVAAGCLQERANLF